MADRPNHLNYPMPSSNGFMNLTPQQQQQLAHHQQQLNAGAAQQIPGVTNPEDQRMWQQIQNSHRAQMGGADGMGQQQMTPQMAELLRRQAAIAQAQNLQQQQQQSPPQLQQAQQFSNMGNMPQMSLANQNALAVMQQQRQGMQGGGMGGPQITPQMAQLLAQRNGTNPAVLQMKRQIGLLNRAQQQQPQNGPQNFGQPGPSFGVPQNLGQLPFSAGMFPPKPDEGRVPIGTGQQQQHHHQQQQQQQQQHQQQPFAPSSAALANGPASNNTPFINNAFYQAIRSSDGRLLTIDELRFRFGELKAKLELDRKELLNSPKPTTQDMANALKERHIHLQQREAVVNRIGEHIKGLLTQQAQQQHHGMQSQQSGPSNNNDGQGQGSMNPLGFPNAAQQQVSQQHLQMNPNWMMNNGSGNNQLGNGMLNNPQTVNGQQQNGQAQAPHQQIASPFHPNLVQSQQQPPVPRSAPTPQQQQMIQAIMQQTGHQPSPQPSSNVVQQGNLVQSVSGPDGQDNSNRPNFPPLAREKFSAMIRDWWQRQGIKFNNQILSVGNRQIDIYQLHTEVLQYGGVLNVKRHDLWNVIAAKMGWSAAALSEVGRTQDQIAEHFKLVYEQLLESFEQTYAMAAMKQTMSAPAQQAADHQGGPSQPGTAPSAQQAMLMIRMANMSAEQMRTAGYPENLINSVEQNRPALQNTFRRMQMQRLVAQQQPQQQQQQQQHMGGVPNNTHIPVQNQHLTQPKLHNSPPMQSQGPIANANPPGHPGINAGSSQQNDMSMQRPQLTPQNMSAQSMQMIGILSNLQKPTPDMVKQAASLIEQLKTDISKERSFRPEHVKNLSDIEKSQFPRLFENLLTAMREVGRVLIMYLASTNDLTIVKGILSMLDMCDKQRQLLQSSAPVYVLDIPTLEKLIKTAFDLRHKVGLVIQQLRILQQSEHNQTRAAAQQQADGGLPPPQSAAPQGLSPHNMVASPHPIPRPPTSQPLPPQMMQQQNLRMPPTRTPQMTPARPPSVTQGKQKSMAATSPNVMDGAPSPAASTPLPASATPNHIQASPQTPKSPKPKAQPKPRPRQRRPSKAVQPTAATTPTATSTSANEPAPSPAQAASPSGENSLKRSREEDGSAPSGSTLPSSSTNEETPSKRMKADWENAPDAEPPKRQVEAENIKTTGQAAQFYSDMTQILELSNNSALPPDLQETLAQLVKTVGPNMEIPDTAGSSSVANLAGSSSPKIEGDDSFFSFLDFTAFQQEDDKADTPDLVPTSSTNPSPESGAGSEVDHQPVPTSVGTTVGDKAQIVDTSESELKSDFFDSGADPLRLGIWGEIDGGESGYFNSSDMWKWDSVPASSGDNSWAIST